MKPLTIEQLKSLKVGDWVWLVKLRDDINGSTGYYRITEDKYAIAMYLYGNITQAVVYSDYGTKWIAYKNKEQAECKGEIVELPYKIGDDVCIFGKHGNEIIVQDYAVKKIQCDHLGICLTLSPSMKIRLDEWLIGDLSKDYLDLQSVYFCTKEQAEARLRELRGENE